MCTNALMALVVAAGCLPQGTVASFAADSESRTTVNPQDQGLSTVLFRHPKNEVLVDVYISEQGPYTFLVDTGVMGAAINTDLAKKLGIPLDEQNSQVFGSGPDKGSRIYQTSIPNLAVGELKFGSLQAAAFPLSIFGDKLGEPVHGILGDGFLKQQATRFDFEDHTLTFADSYEKFAEDLAAAEHVTTLTIDPESDMPVVDVKLNGKPFLASVDIGSSLGLEIFAPYAEEFGLAHAKETWNQVKVTGGSFGTATSYEGSVPAIEVGPLLFKDVPCNLTPARMDKSRKGNIGNQLWAGYVVIIDYGNEKLVFCKGRWQRALAGNFRPGRPLRQKERLAR